MKSRLAIAILTASMLMPAWASPLQAQRRPVPVIVVPPLTVLALNDLSFGTVLSGIPASVSVNDPHHAGMFEIQGPKNASVRVDFSLPTALVSESGALLPVRFGPGDGFADFSHGTPPRGQMFDPHSPVIGALGPNGRLILRLGGTVSPGLPQAGGSYRATISMTVYNLGS
jgi:hypothetical protein